MARTRHLLFSFLFLLLIALEVRAQCHTALGAGRRKLWDDSASSITIVAPPELSVAFSVGANRWNEACAGGSGGSRNAPPFSVVTGTERLPGMTDSNSILVKLEDQPRYGPKGPQDATWDDNASVIAVARYDAYGDPRVLISPGAILLYMHELGHALGLAHDVESFEGASCNAGIMLEPPIGEINAEHCEVIQQAQEPDCRGGASPGELFFVGESLAGRPSGCPSNCDCPDADEPDVFDGIDNVRSLPGKLPGRLGVAVVG